VLLNRLLLFGGKGGVGKTTLAAATALRLAQADGGAGGDVLLVSTDPAHSTSDLLGAKLGGEPLRVHGGLWAMEIDPEADAAAYVAGIREDAAEAVSPEVLPALERHLNLAARAPGTAEAALFERFTEIMRWCPERFERIVFDTAPTGHTLRLLTLPDLLAAWVEGLAAQRRRVTRVQSMWRNLAGVREPPREDRVLARLRQRAHRFAETRRRLREDAVFHPVLTAERLPIAETRRLCGLLAEARIPVGAVYVNRLLPEDAGDSAFLRARREQQTGYLAAIERDFGRHGLVRVPQMARDVDDIESLSALAALLPAGH
jgi:arsenite-transporting ATPase